LWLANGWYFKPKLGGKEMKKELRFLFVCIMVLGAASVSLGQGHLLISEFVNTPTAGEFIEIHNPTPDSVDLSNYYLSDAVFLNNNDYINVVNGFTVGTGSDFMSKFPDGTKIGPGQYMTVAFKGDDFLTTYSVGADFEIRGVDAGTTDMDSVSVGAFPGLSNDGEVIILFYWDGESDLVQDVDIVVWGNLEEAVDKTGVSIDGPDADDVASTYEGDTPIADQTPVNADNDGDENPHDSGNSAQRVLGVEDLEDWANGNGITGHNETSENASWKGGIWSINAPATPNAAALGESPNTADVNFVRSVDIGDDALDDAPTLGDTVSVTGIVMHGPKEIALGSRWGVFLQDEIGGPWSGLLIIQHDTLVTGTFFASVEPGDKIRATGVVEEFPTLANTPSGTQLALFTDPATPIELVDVGLTLPEPILLTAADLGLTPAGNSADPQIAERWEGTYVRFEGLTVLANNLPDQHMTAFDETGTVVLDDYFAAVDAALAANGQVWPGFPPGTRINVNGYVRGASTGGFMTINPRTLADVEVAAAPPEITNIRRAPVVPSPADATVISAVIQDASGTVASANVHYRVDEGAFQQVAMATGGSSGQAVISFADSLYSASIPAQAADAFVEYYLTAKDDTNDSTRIPPTSNFFYFVREGGATIKDLQFTPNADGNSSFVGLEVTVSGIATSDSTDFAFYFLQDGTDPWSGIFVNDVVNNFGRGDEVQVTGTVSEFFNKTQITSVTTATVLSTGNPVPEPLVMKTGDITTGAPGAESYEGMLVRVEKVVVETEFPDSGNFGEFTINDGSGAIRVDDAGNFRGQLDSEFLEGDSLEYLQGVLDYTFSNYKIEPRNDADVMRIITAVNDPLDVPLTYALEQNYPNPFNPETTINYSLATKGLVSLTVYNLMGQKVLTLVDKEQLAGNYVVRWNGLNDQNLKVASGIYFYRIKSGDFTKIQKMLLLK
jgi:hypothetical protein